jgi:2-phosphosulfolactate phosphatase
MGEVYGRKPDGFDFGNSPAELAAADLGSKTLIQRTTAGTQGAVLTTKADPLLACSFANAEATAAFLRRQGAQQVTFVVTGALPDEDFFDRPIRQGDEDAACADYLQALLNEARVDPSPFLDRVRRAPAANKFLDPEQADFSPIDVDYCTRLDAFDFAMVVSRRPGLLVLNRVSV